MADKKNPENADVVIQHTPVHVNDETVFDPRHPAASAFAPAQPAMGVVSDDADDKGQNLAGGPKASEANAALAGEVVDNLAADHKATLAEKAGVEPTVTVNVEGDTAKPAGRKPASS